MKKKKQKKDQKKIINDLREWLKSNSSADLASQLGYKNSSTITQWLLRESIPRWQVPELKKIMGGKRK